MATQPTLAMIPSGYKDGKLYSVLPSDGVGDFTFDRGNGSSTRINKQKLIEGVSNDVPRLDYGISDCPALLLEPSRTNLIPYSEDIANGNWVKYGGGSGSAPVVTNNYAISPDGSLNASRVVFDNTGATSSSDISQLDETVSVSNGDVTNSVWMKSNTASNYTVSFINPSGSRFSTIITTEWQRFELSSVVTNSQSVFKLRLRGGSENTSDYADVSVWGAQTEVGSYPSSYIPTSGSTQTRLAETANGAGDSSTFNDSEGVLIFEASALSNGGRYMTISINDGTSSNHISFLYRTQLNQVWMQTSGSGSDTNITIFDVVQNINNKIALSYSANGIKIFINGLLKGSLAINALPIGLNSVEFNNGAQGETFYGKVKDLRVYKTALTDLELETLTSYTSFNKMALSLNHKIQ